MPVSLEAADDGKPLVISLSMTDTAREHMQGLMDAYLSGDKTLTPRQIIEQSLPEEILESLKPLATKERFGKAVVYSIANTPVMDRHQLLEGLNEYYETKATWTDKHRKNNYTAILIDGIFENMKILPQSEPELLIRHQNDRLFPGFQLHQHEAPISALGGLISNGALTRFVDWQQTIEEAKTTPELGDIKISHWFEDIYQRKNFGTIELRNAGELLLMKKLHIDTYNGANRESYEALLDRHSSYLEAKAGTLLLWREDGTMLHQSTDKTTVLEETVPNPDDVVRIAAGRTGSMTRMNKRPGLLA